MDITFHRSRPDDPDAVRLIEELSETLAAVTGSTGKASFSNADIEGRKSLFLLARRGGTAVACGALRPIDDVTCELKRMYAKEKRAGIGSIVLSRLEAEASRLGYSRIWLETRRVNEPAVAFYRKHGYSVIPNYGKYAGNDAAICFEKKLRANHALPTASAFTRRAAAGRAPASAAEGL